MEKLPGLCFSEKDVIVALLRHTQTPEQVFPDSVLEDGLGDRLRENSPERPVAGAHADLPASHPASRSPPHP